MAALGAIKFLEDGGDPAGAAKTRHALSHPFSIDNSGLSRRAPPARGMLSAQSRRTYAGQAGDLS